ncbi:MAG TPA: hypothetical protein VGX50_21760 [Longimicrobium sp.]|nr:hypothetical protein [Longimicrobium sp.]
MPKASCWAPWRGWRRGWIPPPPRTWFGHPLRIAVWARLQHERADLLRLAGDAAGAALADTRAQELAAEAKARAEGYESDVRELLAPLADGAAGPSA